jgi:hypothetical protein
MSSGLDIPHVRCKSLPAFRRKISPFVELSRWKEVIKMLLRVNLKEGISFTQDQTNMIHTGNGNFFDLIKQSKENNAKVILEDENGNSYERTYNDIYSIEIILGDK